MQKVSLLGDTTPPQPGSLMAERAAGQHGDGMHYVRPDRVTRTGVLAPIWAFNPGRAVMSTAHAFTAGPPSLTQLGYLGRVGLFQRLKMWWQATFSRRPAAAAIVAAAAAPPMTAGPSVRVDSQPEPVGAMDTMGMHVARGQLELVPHFIRMSYHNAPHLVREAADKAAIMYWREGRATWK